MTKSFMFTHIFKIKSKSKEFTLFKPWIGKYIIGKVLIKNDGIKGIEKVVLLSSENDHGNFSLEKWNFHQFHQRE